MGKGLVKSRIAPPWSHMAVVMPSRISIMRKSAVQEMHGRVQEAVADATSRMRADANFQRHSLPGGMISYSTDAFVCGETKGSTAAQTIPAMTAATAR